MQKPIPYDHIINLCQFLPLVKLHCRSILLKQKIVINIKPAILTLKKSLTKKN